MKDDDLQGFASFIGTLPPVPPPPPATPPDAGAHEARRAELAQQHKCVFCHGADLAGGQQVPRIAGQREEYLQMSLRGFKSGERPGYTHGDGRGGEPSHAGRARHAGVLRGALPGAVAASDK